MDTKEAKWKKRIAIGVILIGSLSATYAAAYLYGKPFREIFLLLLLAAVCYGGAVFSLLQSNMYDTLHYNNGEHFLRFMVVFLMGISASCLLALLPDSGWVFPAVALALTLCSNTQTGLVAYAGMVGVCTCLAGADSMVFILYFFIGAFVTLLFEKLDKELKLGPPIFTTMILYSAVLIAKTALEKKGSIHYESLMMPIINIFISFLLILAVLRFYCGAVVERERGQYLDINDQEYELLAKYKEEDSQIYYNAIHTAYFAEKIARKRHMDVDLAKNAAYYHRIIVLECQKQEKKLEEICEYHHFPPKAVQLLQEYHYKSRPIVLREAAMVFLVDSVISSIMYVMHKDENKNMDYGKVAIGILKRKAESGILDSSDISLSDLKEMERIFTGEKLYYDFLRRE